MDQEESQEENIMHPAEIESIVTRIVNKRIEMFRQDLELELLPLRLSVTALETQMTQIRESNSATVTLLGRLEGKTDAFIEEMRVNHRENQQRDERLQALFHVHIGVHEGAEKTEERSIEEEQRISEGRRQWIKVGLSLIGSSAFLKWVHDNWSKFHSHR